MDGATISSCTISFWSDKTVAQLLDDEPRARTDDRYHKSDDVVLNSSPEITIRQTEPVDVSLFGVSSMQHP